MYSQMSQLGQHNAELVLKNIEANTKMADLGARQQALEEDLARAAGERDVPRAAAEQKAREAEAQGAELRRLRTALEQQENFQEFPIFTPKYEKLWLHKVNSMENFHGWRTRAFCKPDCRRIFMAGGQELLVSQIAGNLGHERA